MSKTKPKTFYFIEHTDTYGGESNYSWVNRFKVLATSPKHALTKVKKEVYNYMPRHFVHNYGDSQRIDFPGLCEVMFIDEWDDNYHKHYSRIKEL